MTGLGLIATGAVANEDLPAGNPMRLVNGMDYMANICGIDDKVCGVGYQEAKQTTCYGYGDAQVCTKAYASFPKDDCQSTYKKSTGDDDDQTDTIWDGPYNDYNQTYKVASLPKAYYLPSGMAVCVKECPNENNFDEFICEYDYQAKIDALMASDSTVDNALAITYGLKYTNDYKCMPKVETYDYMGYCMPVAAQDAIEVSMNAALEAKGYNTTQLQKISEKGWWEMFQADFYTSYGVILGCGLGLTAVIGFVYLYILRIPGFLALVVWGIIGTIEAFFLLPGLMLYTVTYPEMIEAAQDKSVAINGTEYDLYAAELGCDWNDPFNQVCGVLGLAYLLLGIAALWVCIICCLRSRIMLALGITQEAARALATMPALILFPVMQAFGLLIFFIPWVIFSIYLASSGKVYAETVCYTASTCVQVKQFEYSDEQMGAGLYMLFIWFWTTQFIVAIGQLVIALAVSQWYFTRDKSKIGNTTVFDSIRMAFRYHMGSAAFGSLIIAIIKTIRAIIMYLQKKAAKAKNKLASAILCCIQCCMWCIEKCMKFINKNAYIQIAIFGFSFCKAARYAFWLILRNILRIAAVGIVSEIVSIMGKCLIPSGTIFLTYMILQYDVFNIGQLYTIYTPLFFTAIISWNTAGVFIEIFSMAISTILQCFVADEEMFKNEPFADGSLSSCIKKTNKDAKDSDKKGGCCSIGGHAEDDKEGTGSGNNSQVVPVQTGGAGPAEDLP